jgi:hypothetical protein
MMKQVFGALASIALVAGSAAVASAECGGGHKSSTTLNQSGAVDAPVVVGEEERMDEVAGVRIVPSVIAKEVALTPSAWMLRDAGSRHASANAKVYTNAQNEIIGLTVTSWGLPDPERINQRYSNYVVWLVDTDSNEVLNVGTLESKNGGAAILGHSPQMPLRGYDRIVITPEPTFATGWPAGWQQLSADIPMTAMVPMEPVEPAQPMAP